MDRCKQCKLEIFNYLSDVGCCKLCCFRYLNITNREYYCDSSKVLKELGIDDDSLKNENKKLKTNPCVVCVGLLQNTDDLVEKIVKCTEISDFDCAAFSVGVSLPATVSVRSHNMKLCLKEQFPNQFSECDLKIEVPLKEVWKWITGPLVAKKVNKIFSSGANCDFLINMNFGYEDDSKELEIVSDIDPEYFKMRKQLQRKYHGDTISRKCIETFLEKCDDKIFKKYCPSPPSVPDKLIFFDNATLTHNPIYFAGRYLKFSRELSQTPWIIDGKRMMESSIQDIITKPFFDNYSISENNIIFSASGREDCDVRCLGIGRPFVLEIINPKKTLFELNEIKQLQYQINESKLIQIRDLQIVQKGELVNIKKGEEDKQKIYQALCISQKALSQTSLDLINNQKEIQLQQKTPIRVLHRRTLAVRPRMIYNVFARFVEGSTNLFTLDMETQAGTYVKEFVHGDFGRTKPNLNSMLNSEIDIVALDVTSVKLDWPKVID